MNPSERVEQDSVREPSSERSEPSSEIDACGGERAGLEATARGDVGGVSGAAACCAGVQK